MVFSAILGLACSAAADHRVPFKGYANAILTGAAPAPDGLHLTVVATGEATHLGSFTRDEETVLHPDGTIEGSLTFVAANGDQLFVDFAGALTSPTTVAGTYTFTGGTGRFTNASGEAAFVGATSDGFHYAIRFNGTISSPGGKQP
jgi:hypothetical protein